LIVAGPVIYSTSMCGDDTLSDNVSIKSTEPTPVPKVDEPPRTSQEESTHEDKVLEAHLADEEEMRLLAKKIEQEESAEQYEEQCGDQEEEEGDPDATCHYCNSPSPHYVASVNMYICGTSVECLEKYLHDLQPSLPPLVEVNPDTIQEAVDITRWSDESDGSDDDASTEVDEPLDQSFLEKTCVLYQESGEEFRVTSYMKKRVTYLNINNAHVKLDDFKNIIHDITPLVDVKEDDDESVSESDLSMLEQERLNEINVAFAVGLFIFILTSVSILSSLYIIASR